MDKDRFLKECSKRGVCKREVAKQYVKSKGENYEFTEKDFEEAFRFEDRMMFHMLHRGCRRYEGTLTTKHLINSSNGSR